MRTVFLLVTMALSAGSASATWSVIAIDRSTGELVIASATCVAQSRFSGFPAKGLMDIQAIVLPGKAVAAAQAGVDLTRKNQTLIFEGLGQEKDPESILASLNEDPNIERRQFGIVDRAGRTAGFSGSENTAASLDVQGSLDEPPLTYSIQGNILASDTVVHDAVSALRNTKGSLSDRVMAAMEAADAAGGDKRCTCDTEPKPTVQCDGKTSHVAYILEAGPADVSGESFNDGRYRMYISATDEDIEPHENGNPVKTLRIRYDAWSQSRQ